MAFPEHLFIHGQQVSPFPELITLSARTNSLSELIATRPEPFWQDAIRFAATRVYPGQTQETIDPLVVQAGLAIRALDTGMVGLFSLREKFVYLTSYLSLDRPADATQFNQLFPVQGPTRLSLAEDRELERERIDRFEKYMDFVLGFAQAAKPNILIPTTSGESTADGGIFTEFDFWVAEEIEALRYTIGGDIRGLAKRVPFEFFHALTAPAERPLPERRSTNVELLGNAIEASYRKMRDRFGLFQNMNLKGEKKLTIRESILEYVFQLDATGNRFSLTDTPDEIAEILGVAPGTVRDHLVEIKKIYALSGHTLEYLPHLESRTIALANLIATVIHELDRPGHYYKYHHYGVIELQAEIQRRIDNRELEDVSIYGNPVSVQLISFIIGTHMIAGSQRDTYPHIQRTIPAIRYQPDAIGAATIVREDLLLLFALSNFTLSADLREKILHTGKNDKQTYAFMHSLIEKLGLKENKKGKHYLEKAREVLRSAIERIAA